MFNITSVSIDQGLLTTARWLNPAHEHILSIMKKCIYKKCIDFIECNISRNNPITKDVRSSNCSVVVLCQKSLEAPGLDRRELQENNQHK